MTIHVLPRPTAEALADLDALFRDDAGELRPVPARDVARIDPALRSAYCVVHGIYQIVTTELVAWLRDECNVRPPHAIEIAAGHGTIGRALGVASTDSYLQTRPDLQAWYARIGQTPIQPPPCVERADALAAVAKHKPRVVVGAYVTQLWREGDRYGNQWGVDELALVARVGMYIKLGTVQTHGRSRVLARRHSAYATPWLFTRALDASGNRAWVIPGDAAWT